MAEDPEQIAYASKRIVEAFNTNNFDWLDELLDKNEVDHNPFPGQAPGAKGVRASIEALRAAFDDMQITQEDLVISGDRCAFRNVGRGTHTGPFMGIPATGKKVDVTEIAIVKWKNGKVVDRWAILDQLTFMQQLGVIPTNG